MVAIPSLPGLTAPKTRLVTRLSDLGQMVETYLRRGEPVAFDIETTGLDPRTGHLITLQFSQMADNVVVVDTREMEREGLGRVLSPLFAGGVRIIGHNLKFDFGWLMGKLGIYPTRAFDTFLAEQVIRGVGRSDAKKQGIDLSLKALAKKYAGVEMSKEERNWFIDLDQRPTEWTAALPPEQIAYAAADVAVLHTIFREQVDLLDERNLDHAAKLEMRALPAITTIEQSGVRVDVAGWRAFIAEKEQQAREIEASALEVFGAAILQARTEKYDQKLSEYQAWEEAKVEYEQSLRSFWDTANEDIQQIGWGKYKIERMKLWREQHPNPGKPKPDTSLPNLGSPAQLKEAFRVMGIAVNSTDSEELVKLEEDYPQVKLLLDYRKASKFVQSFGEALLQYVTDQGRIHPEYVQIGASTGRMSCTRPNWQQVPSKGDGKRLRQLVVAEPGHQLLTADFSNIELRILADITGDETMLRLFADGTDLHSYTARMMFGLGEEVDVAHELLPGTDKTYRFVAKTINFGLVYGMSASKLGRTIRTSRDEAQKLLDAYFRLYPGVVRWLEQARREGIERLESVTLAGRKRYYSLPASPTAPRSKDPTDISAWMQSRQEYRATQARIERQSMNTPIQGTSADITKEALALLYEGGLLQNGLGLARIVAVVHDEIVLETPTAFTALVKAGLAEAMGNAAKTYLKRVTLPPVDVVAANYWSKE